MNSIHAKPDLAEFIADKIRDYGPVTFKWYMEQCLYHPKWGYYTQGGKAIGQKGDFSTNVSVGKLYGYLLARQFTEMWFHMGKPPIFTIMEQGAADGQFADDVLEWIHEQIPEFFNVLTYWIIEPDHETMLKQKQRLRRFPKNKLRWSRDLTDLDDMSLFGIFWSNELVDAFPVHMVTWREGGWAENYVDYYHGEFRLSEEDPSSQQLITFLRDRMPHSMPEEPYRTEVNTAALNWIEEIARVLKRGYVMTCDYGFPRSEYLIPGRFEGTLTCYYQHQRIDDFFSHMGNADMTAHVDFTALAEEGLDYGLDLVGYCDQYRLMVGLGQEEFAELEKVEGELSDHERHELNCFRMLMHPDMMGSRFKFLCMGKEVNEAPGLMGFRYAGDPYEHLGVIQPDDDE